MKTYKMTIKYKDDILDYDWGFNAENQREADYKARNWNSYHSKHDCPGYGFAVAVETTESISIHNDWASV